MAPVLKAGDRLPRVEVEPPGPRSRQLAAAIAATEAPVVNTLFGGQPTVVWQEALGSNVLDVDGNVFVDLTSGFGATSVGHRHPHVVAAVDKQAKTLVHGLGDVASHPARIDLAERLCALAPMAAARVYFAISGADAVEIAMKTAWLATGRPRILAFDPGYHGCTLGALAATSRPAFRHPFEAQLGDWVERLDYGASIDEMVRVLGAEEIAAAVVEPILGREGIVLPPEGWLRDLAALCHQHGTLLVADEIYTGFGRTGSLFASDAENVTPDLLCCGKALGGGMPMAAVLGSAELMRHWDRGGEALHTATFLAHPLACAAALATLDVIDSEGLVERSASLGDRIAARGPRWVSFETVREVRGRGLAWTIELATPDLATSLARSALHCGLLLLSSGPRLQIAPPLVITEQQLDHVLDTLEDLLENRQS